MKFNTAVILIQFREKVKKNVICLVQGERQDQNDLRM